MDVAHHGSTVSIYVVDEIKKHLRELPGEPKAAEKFTIFRVPAHIREKNKELYEPRMVSIGPYYHGDRALQAMEKHKWRYLRDYLSRNPTNSIDKCISELRGLEPQARGCYFEEVKLQSDEFLRMMLLDGCFIIEFLIKFCSPNQVNQENQDNQENQIPIIIEFLKKWCSPNQENQANQDDILDVGWVLPIIKNDLLLLENQIPFVVIEKLFSLLISAQENLSVSSTPVQVPGPLEMLLHYLSEGKETSPPSLELGQIKHILHLYYHCYVPSRSADKLFSTRTFHIRAWLNPIKLIFVFLAFLLNLCFRRRPNSMNRRAPLTIPSATALQDAGISFKSKKSENIFDIKFNYYKGTLEIPFIAIEDTRRSRLLNLVSFEQCYRNKNMDLTSYACFMGQLLKTTRDVTLLQENKIIDNLLATNEELVSFFNWLTECSYLDYEEHYLKELFIHLNAFYSTDWNKWMAKLKRDYFSNPWSIISLSAAIALLVLTFLQTYYTVYSYYHKH